MIRNKTLFYSIFCTFTLSLGTFAFAAEVKKGAPEHEPVAPSFLLNGLYRMADGASSLYNSMPSVRGAVFSTNNNSENAQIDNRDNTNNEQENNKNSRDKAKENKKDNNNLGFRGAANQVGAAFALFESQLQELGTALRSRKAIKPIHLQGYDQKKAADENGDVVNELPQIAAVEDQNIDQKPNMLESLRTSFDNMAAISDLFIRIIQKPKQEGATMIEDAQATSKYIKVITGAIAEDVQNVQNDNKKKGDGKLNIFKKSSNILDLISEFLQDLKNDDQNRANNIKIVDDCKNVTKSFATILAALASKVNPANNEITIVENVEKAGNQLALLAEQFTEDQDENGKIVWVEGIKSITNDVQTILKKFKFKKNRFGKAVVIDKTEKLLAKLNDRIFTKKRTNTIIRTIDNVDKITSETRNALDRNKKKIGVLFKQVREATENWRDIVKYLNDEKPRKGQIKKLIKNSKKAMGDMHAILHQVVQETDENNKIKMVKNLSTVSENIALFSKKFNETLFKKDGERTPVIEDVKKITETVADMTSTLGEKINNKVAVVEDVKKVVYNISEIVSSFSAKDQEGNIVAMENVKSILSHVEGMLATFQLKVDGSGKAIALSNIENIIEVFNNMVKKMVAKIDQKEEKIDKMFVNMEESIQNFNKISKDIDDGKVVPKYIQLADNMNTTLKLIQQQLQATSGKIGKNIDDIRGEVETSTSALQLFLVVLSLLLAVVTIKVYKSIHRKEKKRQIR